MSNYNNVFVAVKFHCSRQKLLAEINCFAAVAKDADVPLDRLSLYLNHLQEIGLIRFSMKEQYIHLTALGHKCDTVPQRQQKPA